MIPVLQTLITAAPLNPLRHLSNSLFHSAMNTADFTTPAGVMTYLSRTKYTATDVQPLSGGWLGFVYRVTLQNPDAAGAKSVILKHTREHASLDHSWTLNRERMTFEYEALEALAHSSLLTPDSTVQVPRVLYYDPEAHVLIMTDLGPVRSISAVLREAFGAGTIKDLSKKIGGALGDFMGRFHKWGSDEAQAQLRARFLENATPRDTSLELTYRLMLETAEKYGIKTAWMEDMVKDRMNDAAKGGSVIAMGDFWFGNILVSTDPQLRVYIIDWELARCARPELDVGQFAAAAYSLTHEHPSCGDFTLMQSFIKSYNVHFALDEVQIGLAVGREVMMPWITEQDDRAKESIARDGLELLVSARKGDVTGIKKNPITHNMYS
ncbi:hypothetical protein FRC12_015004 [Ceratobasidium sp. 428]|nr:hypothetical protein FRC12_015004 [Ceratobasidium sp. 428]